MSDPSPLQPDTQQRARQAATAGAGLYAARRYREAIEQFRTAAQLWPTHPDLHFNLACAALAANELVLARSHLLETLTLQPRHAKAHDALSRLHLQANELSAAEQFAATATRLAPTEPEFVLTRALVMEALGDWSGAWETSEALLNAPSVGDRAASLRARLGPKLGRESQAAEDVLKALASPATDAGFRQQLHYAAAALFDRMQRYPEAFEQAVRAHEILRPPYDSVRRRSEFELRINHWTADRIRTLARATQGSRRPVFIVGMPRSGTTLVEQILACHPQIFGAGELDAMGRAAAKLDATSVPYPRSAESLSPAAADQIARTYLAAINALDSRARYVTDKMPLNFMYLDLIEVLLPESRVIHCSRDPLDTCLSCYMTEFAIPYDFASDLRSLGGFHLLYQRLMEHWKQVLTLPILDVRYEDVVKDIEGQTRHLLEFLELPWDPKCLDFHQNPRLVATASREQVRRPIYASSVGRWKHYEKQLQELIDALRT